MNPMAQTFGTVKFIALNPAKCRKFITKGVNLNMRAPVCAVPPNLEEEFIAKIRRGLQSKQIFEVPEKEFKNVTLAGQASVNMGDDTVTEKAADYGRETLEIRTNPATGQEERLVNHIFQCNGDPEDVEARPDPAPKKKSWSILDVFGRPSVSSAINSEHDEE